MKILRIDRYIINIGDTNVFDIPIIRGMSDGCGFLTYQIRNKKWLETDPSYFHGDRIVWDRSFKNNERR